jgi:hypothetical protein
VQGGYFYLFSLSLEGLLFSGFGWDERDPICFQEILSSQRVALLCSMARISFLLGVPQP